MSIRKILDQLSEMATVSGSVATVATPMGATQRRTKESTDSKESIFSEDDAVCPVCHQHECQCDANSRKAPESPEVANFGLWKNSILAGKEQKAKKKLKVKESVTDYNPPSQGGTRKELLAKLKSAKSAAERSDLATRARKAGASQDELMSASSGRDKKSKGMAEEFDPDVERVVKAWREKPFTLGRPEGLPILRKPDEVKSSNKKSTDDIDNLDETSEQYQGQYPSKAEAIAYAKEKVKSFRDWEDGIEIWSLPSGWFDVVHTSNSNGRYHVIDNGGKKLGTIYPEKPAFLKKKDVAEASSSAQQAAIAVNMKKAGKKPKHQGVAEGSADELNARPGMWRGDAKRMTAKGKPTKDELGMQDNLKNRIKASNKKGGLTGPKGVLPEQGVAEAYDDSMTDAEWERESQREKSEKEQARKEIQKNHVSKFKTKDEAIQYANDKLKTFKDSKIGISVYAMPDGGFDVVSTARNSAGEKRRKLMSDAGGKHLGTLGPRYTKHKMAEGSSERNEMDTPEFQSSLAKMKNRHQQDDKNFDLDSAKELGRRLAARGKRDDSDKNIKEIDAGRGQRALKLAEQDFILNPHDIRRSSLDIVPKVDPRQDHEVEMACSDLYQAAKNARTILQLIKDTPESVGLEGWVQEKIIKASDYLNTVREYLEGQGVRSAMSGNFNMGNMLDESVDNPLESALVRRFMSQHTDVLQQYGPTNVLAAIEDVASDFNPGDELGTSDVSAYVRSVLSYLDNNYGNQVDENVAATLMATAAAGAGGILATKIIAMIDDARNRVKDMREKRKLEAELNKVEKYLDSSSPVAESKIVKTRK